MDSKELKRLQQLPPEKLPADVAWMLSQDPNFLKNFEKAQIAVAKAIKDRHREMQEAVNEE